MINKKPNIFSPQSDFQTLETTYLPAQYSVLYRELPHNESEQGLRFNDGKIRLCEVSLAPSDYYNNPGAYVEDKEDGCLSGYAAYQYQNNTQWRVFVESENWILQGLKKTAKTGAVCLLANGMLVLHVDKPEVWEAYCSMPKNLADKTVKLLNELQENNKSLLQRASD